MITLHVKSGYDLFKAEEKRSSSPYLEIKINGQTQNTKVISQTTYPVNPTLIKKKKSYFI